MKIVADADVNWGDLAISFLWESTFWRCIVSLLKCSDHFGFGCKYLRFMPTYLTPARKHWSLNLSRTRNHAKAM